MNQHIQDYLSNKHWAEKDPTVYKTKRCATVSDILGIDAGKRTFIGGLGGGGANTLQTLLRAPRFLPVEHIPNKSVNDALAYPIPMYPTRMEMDDSGYQGMERAI